MIGALWTGISGLASHQTALDNESHNIANVNTVGYKASRIAFADQMYQDKIGKGSKVLDAEKIYEQGGLKVTGVSYDVALSGEGFFTVADKNSGGGTAETYYTRAGNFRMGDNGTLQDAAGNEVQGWIMSQIDSDVDVVTTNPNITKFTNDYTKLVSSQIVSHATYVETITAKTTDYNSTSKADSSTVFTGAGYKSESGKISDIEELSKAYATALQKYKDNPDGTSASAVTQISYIDFQDEANGILNADGDIISVYINGVKKSQQWDTDYATTMKKLADEISSIPGIKAYTVDTDLNESTADADVASGILKIENLIPGQSFLVTNVLTQSGQVEVNGSIRAADGRSAVAGSGLGALESVRDKLSEAVSGKQRDVFLPTDLFHINQGTGLTTAGYEFNYELTIWDKDAQENITLPSSGLPFEIGPTISGEPAVAITQIAEAINTNLEFDDYITAKVVNGALVIETLNSNFDVEFSGKLSGPTDIIVTPNSIDTVSSDADTSVVDTSSLNFPATDTNPIAITFDDGTMIHSFTSTTAVNELDLATEINTYFITQGSLATAVGDDVGRTVTLTAAPNTLIATTLPSTDSGVNPLQLDTSIVYTSALSFPASIDNVFTITFNDNGVARTFTSTTATDEATFATQLNGYLNSLGSSASAVGDVTAKMITISAAANTVSDSSSITSPTVNPVESNSATADATGFPYSAGNVISITFNDNGTTRTFASPTSVSTDLATFATELETYLASVGSSIVVPVGIVGDTLTLSTGINTVNTTVVGVDDNTGDPDISDIDTTTVTFPATVRDAIQISFNDNGTMRTFQTVTAQNAADLATELQTFLTSVSSTATVGEALGVITLSAAADPDTITGSTLKQGIINPLTAVAPAAVNVSDPLALDTSSVNATSLPFPASPANLVSITFDDNGTTRTFQSATAANLASFQAQLSAFLIAEGSTASASVSGNTLTLTAGANALGYQSIPADITNSGSLPAATDTSDIDVTTLTFPASASNIMIVEFNDDGVLRTFETTNAANEAALVSQFNTFLTSVGSTLTASTPAAGTLRLTASNTSNTVVVNSFREEIPLTIGIDDLISQTPLTVGITSLNEETPATIDTGLITQRDSADTVRNTMMSQLDLVNLDDIEKNATHSGKEGANAEFIELRTKVDQTASRDSLQLRLDTLGISDSAFGEFSVDQNGLITIKQDGVSFAVGQLAIALFNNNRGLDPAGDNLLAKTNDSGDPIYSVNNAKAASVQGRTLELSGADLSESLVNLMVFQRAFEANAKSITTSDELLNTLINLKR